MTCATHIHTSYMIDWLIVINVLGTPGVGGCQKNVRISPSFRRHIFILCSDKTQNSIHAKKVVAGEIRHYQMSVLNKPINQQLISTWEITDWLWEVRAPWNIKKEAFLKKMLFSVFSFDLHREQHNMQCPGAIKIRTKQLRKREHKFCNQKS